MNLYDRDFTAPTTKEEADALVAEYEFENLSGFKLAGSAPRFSHPKAEVRDFLWHATSLFPNNHLNPITVRELDIETEAKNFLSALDSAPNEQSIQAYIKEKRKWYIPASIYKEYNFGHHDAYLFPEQQLGAEYRADYMLLGKNSDGFSLVLIEFEDVNVDFLLTTSVAETEYVRRGITQIRDWKRWLDSNR